MASRQITHREEMSAIGSGIVVYFHLSIGLFLSHGQIWKLIHQIDFPFTLSVKKLTSQTCDPYHTKWAAHGKHLALALYLTPFCIPAFGFAFPICNVGHLPLLYASP